MIRLVWKKCTFCWNILTTADNRIKSLNIIQDQDIIEKFNIKKQVRRGTYRESENLLRSIDIW